MSFDNWDTSVGSGSFLQLKAGESAVIHIMSKSPTQNVVHWVNGKKVLCSQDGNCEPCAKGVDKKKTWTVDVLDRSSDTPKKYEFGPMIAAQIKEIHEALKKAGQSIHDTDLSIKRKGGGKNDTEYFVIPVPMGKGKAKPSDLADVAEDEVPF